MSNNTLDLTSITDELENNIDLIIRRFTLGTFVRAQKKSPVDEGRFRSSIIVSLNTTNSSQSTSPNSSPVGGIDQSALSAATSIVNGFSLSTDRSLHIQSNLPYSANLEQGSSSQAPSGVFKMALREELEAFNNYGNS